MDCNQIEELFKQIESSSDDHLVDTNVGNALERLKVSADKPTVECFDSQKEQQTNKTSEDMIFDIRELFIQFPNNHLNTSMTPDVSHKEDKQEINIKEEIESISETKDNSDSITETLTDKSDESDKRDNFEKCCEVTQNTIKNINSVIDSDRLPVSRYPLKYRWQLWFWRADHGVKVVWEEALQRVCKPFETVEQFWRLYHHIIPVKQLVPPSDYCVFKEGINPMWEDSKNINGGKWTLEFHKGVNREVNPFLDEIWLEVLLCLIGEGFNEFGEDICGAVVNIRAKSDRISVWTANADKSVANLKIGEILKIRSGYEGKMKYEAHSTSQRIAVAKNRLFDSKPHIFSKSRPKPCRRSCVF